MLMKRSSRRVEHWTGGFLCLLAVSFMAASAREQPHSFKPQDGFIPNESTAIRVGEAVLMPIYGEEKIKSERPFVATLNKGVWTVQGTLPEGWVGGVAVIEIAQSDARILRVSHGK